MIDFSGPMQQIRKAGANNVRAIPMAGQNAVSGNYQIEIREGNEWRAIAAGITRTIADNLIAQATNKVICG